MSNGPSEDALTVIRNISKSQAAMTASRVYMQYLQGVRAGRDPDICFMEAFLGIYKTPEFPGPLLPEPFDTVEDLQRTLKQAPAVFKKAAELAATDLVEIEALLNKQAVEKPG